MKCCVKILLFCVSLCFVGCQPDRSYMVFESQEPQSQDAVSKSVETRSAEVEVSCGQCQFGMSGEGCDLAVKMNEHVYYVDGSSIDDHGDAHATDGLCNCVRKAIVSGKVVDGRFIASELKLVNLTGESSIGDASVTRQD